MRWRKGCFCGCTHPEECLYLRRDRPPETIVHIVHHYVRDDEDIIDGYVVEEQQATIGARNRNG